MRAEEAVEAVVVVLPPLLRATPRHVALPATCAHAGPQGTPKHCHRQPAPARTRVHDALERDVKGGGQAARRVDPVDGALAVRVLVVGGRAVPFVRQRVPVLAWTAGAGNSTGRLGGAVAGGQVARGQMLTWAGAASAPAQCLAGAAATQVGWAVGSGDSPTANCGLEASM